MEEKKNTPEQQEQETPRASTAEKGLATTKDFEKCGKDTRILETLYTR